MFAAFVPKQESSWNSMEYRFMQPWYTYCHMSVAPCCVEHRGFPLGTTHLAEAVLPIASQRPPEISINLFLKL